MRTVVNLNYRWAFTKQATTVPTAIDPKWDFVNLPHTWNAIDGQDGGGDFYRGAGYYAKAVQKMDLPESERYYLEFRGANSSADVYWNGKLVGHHDGGYSTWRVDISAEMAADNLIVVVVDNAPSNTVYPQMADFTFYGGLYRDVNLICVPESHFGLMQAGGPGIHVTPEICGNDAKVKVETWPVGVQPGQTVHVALTEPDGTVAAQGSWPCGTPAELVISQVHRWHGRKDPFLYTATAELRNADGTAVDCVSAAFGCRTFAIDPEHGFLLNGEEYPLHGVSRHQDRWGIGNALLPEHHREDMDLICEVGATTIRLAHYQHDQYFYDLCDQRGMVVWAEIPYISQHMPEGRENTISQMTELITQNYNHPSIVVWGLSNEITMKGADDPDLIENHRILNDLCHRMDPTRLTTMAIVSMCPLNAAYIQIPDVVSWNHYFGWYGGDTSMNGPWFDQFHAAHPNIPVGCSEYGCEALNWHTSNPRQGDYTEEYQAFYHEELIRQLFSRKYIWATHVWNMFDFGADNRSEGGENGQNHKGLVTFDRTYKKDSFYAYKAWLSQEPFVHICSKRYVDRVEPQTTVKVYSNLPQVELFCNGVALGTQEAPDHFFTFIVPNQGESHLVAKAGDCTDEARIRKVEEPNPDYILREKGAILNWFDITEPEGYLSLNSTLNEILATVRGKMLMVSFAGKLLPKKGDKAMGFELTGDMMKMMGSFTVLRLTSMMGLAAGMAGGDAGEPAVTKEALLDLNHQLNKIRKKGD